MPEHFPKGQIALIQPGRKQVPTGKVLEAPLSILATDAGWHGLPPCYPNCKTLHARFQHSCENAPPSAALCNIGNALGEEGALDTAEYFVDASFASVMNRSNRLTDASMKK
jgi:hypothetical protein